MESGRFQSFVLIAAVIGVSVLGLDSRNIGASVGDLAILLALLAFDDSGRRSGSQSIAFAGVSAFCLLTPLLFLAANVLGASVPMEGASWLFAGIWAVLTLVMFGVDRFRVGARENVSMVAAGLSAAAMTPIVTNQPPSGYRPAPIRVEPVVEQPVYAQPQPQPLPVYAPAAPILAEPVAQLEATNFAAPVVSAAVVAPPPDVTAIPPGREAVIYLNLVGEGLNVLRTVRAENLGRDYYRIADVMPEGEQWEFTPGQVVKCRKKSLSNGKQMVAYEEAPRAQ
jgi:hypothetical protein